MATRRTWMGFGFERRRPWAMSVVSIPLPISPPMLAYLALLTWLGWCMVAPAFEIDDFVFPFVALPILPGFIREVTPWHPLYRLPWAVVYLAMVILPPLACADLRRSIRRDRLESNARTFAGIALGLPVALVVMSLFAIVLTPIGWWYDIWFQPFPPGAWLFCGHATGDGRGWPLFAGLCVLWPLCARPLWKRDVPALLRATNGALIGSAACGLAAVGIYKLTHWLYWEWNPDTVPYDFLGRTGYLPAMALCAVSFVSLLGCRLLLLPVATPPADLQLCPDCGYDVRASPVACPECGYVRHRADARDGPQK